MLDESPFKQDLDGSVIKTRQFRTTQTQDSTHYMQLFGTIRQKRTAIVDYATNGITVSPCLQLTQSSSDKNIYTIRKTKAIRDCGLCNQWHHSEYFPTIKTFQ